MMKKARQILMYLLVLTLFVSIASPADVYADEPETQEVAESEAYEETEETTDETSDGKAGEDSVKETQEEESDDNVDTNEVTSKDEDTPSVDTADDEEQVNEQDETEADEVETDETDLEPDTDGDDESYTVTLYPNGGVFDSGNATETITVRKGYSSGIMDIFKAVSREGYELVGWSTTPDGEVEFEDEVSADEDTSLYAVWRRLYKVILNFNEGIVEGDENDGKSVIEEIVPEGDGISLYRPGWHPTLVRDKYEFLGWSTKVDGDVEYDGEDDFYPQDDTTLYAVWMKLLKVTLIANGGKFSDGKTTDEKFLKKSDPDEEIWLPDELNVTRKGYVLKGWSTKANGKVKYFPDYDFRPDNDMTLYAAWAEAAQIKLDANGGFFDNDKKTETWTGEKGSGELSFGAYIPTRKGYKVSGWAEKKGGKKKYGTYEKIKPKKNATYYAVWRKPCKIKLDANGGEFVDKSTFKTWKESDSLNSYLYLYSYSNSVVREGYDLVGWSTKKNGKIKYDTDESEISPEKDMTLYAIWGSASITLDKTSVKMKPGESVKLAASIKKDIKNKKVTWRSDDESVATVSSKGKVTAMSGGTAVITATASNGKTAKCTVQVPGVAFNTSKLVLKKGKTTSSVKVILTNDSLKSAESDNKSVATVKLNKNKLKISGKKPGKAKITVKTKEGLTATLSVTVQKKAVTTTKLTVSKSNVTISRMRRTKVTATATPDSVSTGQKLKVSSSDKKIATASLDEETGEITIRARKTTGKCTITVKAGNESKKITVKVK